MPGLCFSNELIARDEGLHTEFACMLFRHLSKRPEANVIHQVIKEAVTLEQQFVTGMYLFTCLPVLTVLARLAAVTAHGNKLRRHEAIRRICGRQAVNNARYTKGLPRGESGELVHPLVVLSEFFTPGPSFRS